MENYIKNIDGEVKIEGLNRSLFNVKAEFDLNKKETIDVVCVKGEFESFILYPVNKADNSTDAEGDDYQVYKKPKKEMAYEL